MVFTYPILPAVSLYPAKRLVALGQAYFAIQARRADPMQELDSMTHEQKRIDLRDQSSELNGQLAELAFEAGVEAQQDFTIFRDHSWTGLYVMNKHYLAKNATSNQANCSNIWDLKGALAMSSS